MFLVWLAPLGCLYYFCSFLPSSGLIHLVFRPTRESNSPQRAMAQTVSPRLSPLDQGASLWLDVLNIFSSYPWCSVEQLFSLSKNCLFVFASEYIHSEKDFVCVVVFPFSLNREEYFFSQSLWELSSLFFTHFEKQYIFKFKLWRRMKVFEIIIDKSKKAQMSMVLIL